MDRVIKFRGKELPSNKWIFASAYVQENELFIIDFANFIVLGETVGQFTGFKDIDGKEVFEGDILLNNTHNVDFVYRVEWHIDCWVGVRNDDAELLGNLFDAMPLKVIGNIHDNSELLKGGVET